MATHEHKIARRAAGEQSSERRGPHLWEIQALLDLLLIAGTGLLLWLLYELRSIFTPVLIALGLAYLCNPLITSAQNRWRMPRPATITLLLVVFALGAATFLAWLAPLLVEQAQTLASKAPQYLETIGGRYGIELAGILDQLRARTQQDDLLTAVQPIVSGTGQALGQTFKLIGAVIGTTGYIAMTAMLLPIYFFFFAWRLDAIASTTRRLIPAEHRGRALDILEQIDRSVMSFFRGRLLVALITGMLYAAGWAWTDVPYWFLLGTGTGLLSIIPYVNAIGWPLAILLKYVDVASNSGSMDWLSILVLPSLPYLVVQFFESWWLTPWVEGYSSNLAPVTVIIVVLVGGAVGGFLGLLLAIPIAASVKILFQELILPRWEPAAGHDGPSKN